MFLQNDVQKQFVNFSNAADDYYESISDMQHIISDIADASGTFTDIVEKIETQIHEISENPDNQNINRQEIIDKAKQTAETTEEMIDIVNRNKENAKAISEIVDRFS